MLKPVLSALLGALILTAGVPAVAEETAAAGVTGCSPEASAQRDKDTALAQRAFDAMGDRDMAGLNALLPELEAALGRAPDGPVASERCGDTIHIYDDDPAMALDALVGVAAEGGNDGTVEVVLHRLPYADIAFAIGWIYVEKKDFRAAHHALARGRRNDPHRHDLVSEDALALGQLGRNEEALALLDGFIAAHPDLEPEDLALLHRKRGWSLIELKRWDEAEAAYRESLRLEPGNTTAQGELDYIAQSKPSKN